MRETYETSATVVGKARCLEERRKREARVELTGHLWTDTPSDRTHLQTSFA